MSNIEQLSVNTIRILSAEAVQKANSGHPGLPLGAAPMAYTLWAKQMKHNSKNPNWINRDRFVLSAGHGSMLLYSLLHLFGYGLTIDDVKDFRQLGSKTPGHPEYGHTVGVEATTGPLGQGIATSVGMAMAEKYLAAHFNRPDFNIVDHYTYVLSGDGCMMEGISSEAASLAGTLELGKLIVLYDSNNISIEGNTDIAFREDVGKRFEAFGWQVIIVEDGTDIEAINRAIEEAKSETKKPTLIEIKTQIGYGVPEKQGKASAHGEPLGIENITAMKGFLGWEPDEEFHVSSEVRDHMNEIMEKGNKEEQTWNDLWNNYKKTYPDLAKAWELWNDKRLPVDLLNDKELWSLEGSMATRAASGKIINHLAKVLPNLIGGSADLAPSNKTYMNGKGDFSAENPSGSNLHFGIREHAMAAILNGMKLHGGLIVYGATFFVFSDYMKASMRLSALMNLPVIYVLTHDSIGVGEDGPTHQPIEQLAALRSMPNFTVFRPADAKETAAAWYSALTSNRPTALVLTRQNLPDLATDGKSALKGAYILKDSEKPDVILIGTGSEVQLISQAADILQGKGINARVISMPSWEIFEEQSEEYKNKLLPKNITKRLAVEAAVSFGWHKYVGCDGKIISMDTFGTSGPAELLFKHFGFTVENIVKTVEDMM